MSATAQKAEPEFSAEGHRLRCQVCAVKLRHPKGSGRPRVICPKRECRKEYERRYKARARQEPAQRWTVHDWAEALHVWENRCGICLEPAMFLGRRAGTDVLPVCFDCSISPITDLAQRWLSNCKPGCPLPNPYAGPDRG